MHLDAALSLTKAATARLYCVARTGQPSLCDMHLTVHHGIDSTNARYCVCVCTPHALPSLVASHFPTSSEPWVGPPSPIFFDRRRVAQAQQAQEHAARFLASPASSDLTDSCAVLIAAVDEPFRACYASSGWLNTFGYSLDEVRGVPCLDLLQGQATCSRTLAALRSALHDGRDLTVRLVQHTKRSPQLLSTTIALRRLSGDLEHRVSSACGGGGAQETLIGLVYSGIDNVDLSLVRLTSQPTTFVSGAEQQALLANPYFASPPAPIHHASVAASTSASSVAATAASAAAAGCKPSCQMPPPPPRPPKRLASEMQPVVPNGQG